MTEQEIIAGILLNKGPVSAGLCFAREITNAQDHLDTAIARKFMGKTLLLYVCYEK